MYFLLVILYISKIHEFDILLYKIMLLSFIGTIKGHYFMQDAPIGIYLFIYFFYFYLWRIFLEAVEKLSEKFNWAMDPCTFIVSHPLSMIIKCYFFFLLHQELTLTVFDFSSVNFAISIGASFVWSL